MEIKPDLANDNQHHSQNMREVLSVPEEGSLSVCSTQILSLEELKQQNLAIPTHLERTCGNARPAIDPESIERFCRTWAEVGQAILARRNKANDTL